MNGIIPSDSLSCYETFRFSWNTGCIILERSARSLGGLYTMDRQRRKTLCIAVREEPKGTSCRRGGSLFPFGSQSADWGQIWAGKALDRFFCGCLWQWNTENPLLYLGTEGRLGDFAQRKRMPAWGDTEQEYSELTYCFENEKI